MAADYSKYKTPYYEIEISDSSGQKLVRLPHHILRLVEKVEILETFEPNQLSTITIDFIEGSREPASTNAALGTDGLYKIPVSSDNRDIDMAISGSITNRSGSLADLRFSGDNGITFLTEKERKQGKIDRTPQFTVQDKIETRAHLKEDSKPTFLFQERNQVKVTWGYLEDPSSKRSIRGYILMLTTSFPENGQVRTSVVCQPTRTALDQIATVKGKPFGTRERTTKGNSIVAFKDLKTDDLIRKIADDAGMAHIVSKNLPADTVDADKQKLWIGGESFDQFMVKLAAEHNCYYNVIPDPNTGKDTIVFIKKTEYEGRLVITDTDLTTYKGPGSILKSVDIKADFGKFSGNSQAGITKDAKEQRLTTDLGDVALFKGQQAIPNSPINNGNPVLGAKGIAENVANGGVTGTVDMNPSNNKKRIDDIAKNKAEQDSRNIALEFTSLGYTGYHPGVIEFKNLGVRYSGKYRLMTVTHTIDSNGYSCRGSALSMAVATGGVAVPEAEKPKEPPKKSNEQQFKPQAKQEKLARDLYFDMQQVAKN